MHFWSKHQFVDFPFFYFEMTAFCSTKHLSTSCAQCVISIVKALRKVCATIWVVKRFICYLEVRVAKRRAKSSTAPNSLFFVDERISLSGSEIKNEGGLRMVWVPLASIWFPRKRSKPSNNLFRFCEYDCQCICDIITFFMKLCDWVLILTGSEEKFDIWEFVIEKVIYRLYIVCYFAEKRRLW